MSPFLLVSLALFSIWAILLLVSVNTRREQAIMSIVGLLLSPGALLLAAGDYRAAGAEQAFIGIEDLMFSFCLFGISAVVYQILLGKRTANWRGERTQLSNPTMHWMAHLILLLGVWAFVALIMTLIFGLGSIQAFIVGGILVGTYVIADRKDLMFDALLSGTLVAMLVFICEQIFFTRLFPEAAAAFWDLQNLSGIALGGIPMEELLWAAVVGYAVGPSYEYVRRYKLM